MTWTVLQGDARALPLADGSVQTCVTSPPYWGLRDYGVDGQLGLEQTPQEYVEQMVEVFREVRRVLRDDGTLWLNLGDSYAGSWGAKTGSSERTPGLKPKDLVGIPWRVAFALQADGWWLCSDIIWSKPNPMPESVTDRPTRAHEYLFLLTKSARYYYDHEAVKVDAQPRSLARIRQATFDQQAGGEKDYGNGTNANRSMRKTLENFRKQDALGKNTYAGFNDRWRDAPTAKANLRSVWHIPTTPYPGAHFATFPPKLIEPCIKAGAPSGGMVLDPFAGSGTTGMVALRHGRSFVGVELNAEYVELARARIIGDAPLLNGAWA